MIIISDFINEVFKIFVMLCLLKLIVRVVVMNVKLVFIIFGKCKLIGLIFWYWIIVIMFEIKRVVFISIMVFGVGSFNILFIMRGIVMILLSVVRRCWRVKRRVNLKGGFELIG